MAAMKSGRKLDEFRITRVMGHDAGRQRDPNRAWRSPTLVVGGRPKATTGATRVGRLHLQLADAGSTSVATRQFR
jgi:hypothetical protein